MYIVTKSWNDFKRLDRETTVTNLSANNNHHLPSLHIHSIFPCSSANDHPEDSGHKNRSPETSEPTRLRTSNPDNSGFDAQSKSLST